MLEQISWKEFLVALAGGCAAYYLVLAVAGKIRVARRRDNAPAPVPAFSKPKQFTAPPPPAPAGITETITRSPAENEEDGPEDAEEFNALELLADEVQLIISNSAGKSETKEELLAALRQEIARYPTLNQPVFQRAIGNLIVKVTSEECAFTINHEEARECWPDV